MLNITLVIMSVLMKLACRYGSNIAITMDTGFNRAQLSLIVHEAIKLLLNQERRGLSQSCPIIKFMHIKNSDYDRFNEG